MQLPTKAAVVFRFYEELNDFLPPARRRRDFSVSCARAATTKHMIEALGVPHTEVELVLVNGESVSVDHLLPDPRRHARSSREVGHPGAAASRSAGTPRPPHRVYGTRPRAMSEKVYVGGCEQSSSTRPVALPQHDLSDAHP